VFIPKVIGFTLLCFALLCVLLIVAHAFDGD
jgi:hypothetical protein